METDLGYWPLDLWWRDAETNDPEEEVDDDPDPRR